jgi:polar amino acid transport system substrate-binding protein
MEKMKRFFSLISFVLVAGLLLAACKPATTDHLAQIKAAGVIKVGTSADYPPFEFVDANGNKTGFDIDLMAEIAKRMAVTLEWVDMPFDSLVAGVQEGKIDASIAAFNYDEERDKVVDFTDAYYTSEDAFIVADSFSGTITDPLTDLVNFKIGVQTGAVQEAWLKDNLVTTGIIPEANLFSYERADQAALDLKNGRIDVLMLDYIPAQALAAQIGGLKVIYHGVLSTGPVNIIIPQGDTALAEAMNGIIAQLLTEGFIDQLADKYFTVQ